MMNDILKLILPVLVLIGAGTVWLTWPTDNPPPDPAFTHPPVPSTSGSGVKASSSAPSSANVSQTFFNEVAIYREKLATNREDTLSMRKLGRLLQDGHGEENAVERYEAYLRRNPENHQVWLDLAATYAALKRWKEAEDAMDRMLTIYTGDESARYNKAAIAANEGRIEDARRIWTKLAESENSTDIARRARTALSRLDAS